MSWLSDRVFRNDCLAALSAVVGPMVFCAGCGDRGPERFRVQGAVTSAGTPVPMGRIVFEPDASRGNRGPQGFAPIENGRFDTAAKHCQGAVGGPTIVRIDGFTMAKGAADAASAGRQLFPTHEIRIELPPAASTHDFDVPVRPTR